MSTKAISLVPVDPAAHRPPGRDGLTPIDDIASLAQATVEARAALEEAAIAAAAAAERAFSVAEALDDAIAGLSDEAPARPVGTSATLSPREREVLALLAEGRTNKAIAEALFVSPNTVKTHVASLMGKLQAGSRAHLAAIATRQALA